MSAAHIMMAGAAFAALAGCATPPAPEPRIVTQTVNVPVRAPCPDPADVPQVPRRVAEEHPQMPADPNEQGRILAAKVIELFGYAVRADALLRGCSGP
ncbi:hypothetical protein [Sphingosinicella ginsenosidimutans]|uniref:Lipoprotein n=1 Tax=Allosphingosinicella ginsenosidimutans TaxID=1176539 RepID=A0A5C6TTW4_9SPHN|nr:hypothetical protein [Sphingosinicella ginsenosidimutans]TXC63659.1 hypothetical protein FRZ32_08305 [Sphingosinicella ginsenosidimutans]